MITGHFFTGFAKFRRTVCVNDFRAPLSSVSSVPLPDFLFPRRLHELLQSSFRFL